MTTAAMASTEAIPVRVLLEVRDALKLSAYQQATPIEDRLTVARALGAFRHYIEKLEAPCAEAPGITQELRFCGNCADGYPGGPDRCGDCSMHSAWTQRSDAVSNALARQAAKGHQLIDLRAVITTATGAKP